ncbi:flagellum-specific ATP synthase [Alkalispirochaeta americana]|uniref:Flagellum-specific ATP synthase n=1 Tax=Alkalispirochaeta americana TaxID=159291 RepID=A0A1N6PLF2_9SPIO|nr:FliI/YscN family ATPase [Alkalispirochaeta americana]SIQ05136.1 flagellum-specific ATP synthase [Alkalispirochaeta americana]
MAIEFLEKYQALVDQTETIRQVGRVQAVEGLRIESLGPQARVGELCQIHISSIGQTVLAEVIGAREGVIQLAPYGEIEGIEVGNLVIGLGETLSVSVGDQLLGRVLDGLGNPLDGLGDIAGVHRYPAIQRPPDVLSRRPIQEQIETGIRAIDGLIPTGKGQRLGIFSGSGVGKSTLIGMIARNTSADVNVIALIGERGREVREFIENDLGEEGLARSVVVVSTSDTPALARLRAAYVATAVAEFFRDQGRDVMLMFDSVTRFARAQREIGLARGEGPASRGYPASVDAVLPQLLERCGTSEKGTITGFYTILVEGDDMDEPVSDAVRGILDGHLVLSRELAQRYHYPAIDVLASVSRLVNKITLPDHRDAAGALRRLLADYKEAEDLINAGVYVAGSNPAIDEAIRKRPMILKLLQQSSDECSSIEETRNALREIAGMEMADA